MKNHSSTKFFGDLPTIPWWTKSHSEGSIPNPFNSSISKTIGKQQRLKVNIKCRLNIHKRAHANASSYTFSNKTTVSSYLFLFKTPRLWP